MTMHYMNPQFTEHSESINLRQDQTLRRGTFITGRGEEAYGTPLLAAVAANVNFTEGIFFTGKHIVS